MAKIGGLGLGRGLDALIGNQNSAKEKKDSNESNLKNNEQNAISNAVIPSGIEMDENGGLWADPNLLVPNPHQPRKEFNQKDLEELADSVRENGVIEPILIEKADDGKFFIIAGERRTRAAKIAGLEKVPVQIRKYDEVKKLEVALIENIQRADLNPIEEAQAYYNLMELGDFGQEEVAKRVGKKRPTIANAIRLLKLPEDIQKALVEGQISAGHARALLQVANSADQRILFGKIVGNGMSVREAEELAKSYNEGGRAASKKEKKPTEKKDPDIVSIEQKFIEVFGTKVTLKGTLEKGSIQIEYFSKEDLDRLYNIVVKN